MDQSLYLIPAALRDALHNYLLSRPMGEVEPVVAALRQLQPAPLSIPHPSEAHP